MKILFITDNLFPDTNASSEIVYRICESMKREYPCDLYILGYHSKGEGPSPSYVTTLPLKSVDAYNLFYEKHPEKLKRNVCVLLSPSLLHHRLGCGKERYWTHIYEQAIRSAIRNYSFDAIVAVSMPFYSILPFCHIRTDIPLFLYLLDPLSTHKNFSERTSLLKKFAVVDEKASGLFVTNLIYRETEGVIPEQIRSKMTVLDFPNIIPYTSVSKLSEFSGDAVHMVFCGCFYPEIRTPDFLFALYQKLNENNIVLHIVGHNAADAVIPQNMKDRVVFHGRVSADTARVFMQNADILVNVGNSVPNQLPSKLLTYISCGKPILNLIKTDCCPSLKYMTDYPLGLTVSETSELTDNLVRMIVHFCHIMKGKRIPFEDIRDRYKSCTPEYVSKQIYDVIQTTTSPKGVQ